MRTIQIRDGRCIVFSHKGDRLAACGGDIAARGGGGIPFIVIIEVATGMVLSTFKGHEGSVACVAFSPDDSLLVSGSRDHAVILWDVKTGGLVRTLRMEEEVNSVGFSHDGKMIACDFGIWDGALVEPIQRFDEKAQSLAWSPSKTELVLGYESGSVRMLDVKNNTYRELLPGGGGSVSCVAYSRDGTRIASGSWDGVVIHGAETGNIIQIIPVDHQPSVCFSPGGERLAIVHQRSMVIWDLENSVSLATFGQQGWAESVSVSPDGTTIAFADNAKLSLWPMHPPGRSSEATSQLDNLAMCLAISPDSTFLASGSYDDKTVKIWHFDTGACLHTFEGHSSAVYCVAVSPNSSLIASGSTDLTIRIWRVTDRALVCTLGGHELEVTGVAFFPDGQRIASVSKNVVRLWDIKTGAVIGILGDIGFGRGWPGIRLSHDGAGITVFSEQTAVPTEQTSKSWKLEPPLISSTVDHPADLQITFSLQNHAFEEDPSLALYGCSDNFEWITDQHGHRVCWLPPELRGRWVHQGSIVAIAALTMSERVSWFDFDSLLAVGSS
jgi:WD40 repeat protein